MAREKWMIDPAEYDEFQREIAGISTNASFVIKGCAGSGKTVLALDRVDNIRIKAIAENENIKPSFTFIVYTKALKEFIRTGALEKGIDIDQIIHFDKWDGQAVDYLVIDEAQDFTKDQIEKFNTAKGKSIMLYGDSNQQVYKLKDASPTLSIEEIQQYLNLRDKELNKNYRLPRLIASFASELSDDKDLENKCTKSGTEKPKLIKFEKWQDELDYIINEIKTRNYEDVCILLPWNVKTKATRNNGYRNVESVIEYFDKKGFLVNYKMRNDDNDTMELDFDSNLPKVMTFHSSKGLQFETVFIPFCDIPNHDDWLVENYKNALYVALTRTHKNLYLTYSETLTPFFSKIDNTKYDKI
jgi:superfamily I DNA/RNA helicase